MSGLLNKLPEQGFAPDSLGGGTISGGGPDSGGLGAGNIGGIDFPAANLGATDAFAGSVAGSIPGGMPSGVAPGIGSPAGFGPVGGAPAGIGGGPAGGITGSPGGFGGGSPFGFGGPAGVPSGADPTFGLGHILDIIGRHRGTPIQPGSPIGPPRAGSGGYPTVFPGLPGQLPAGRNMALPYSWLGGSMRGMQ